MLVTDAVIYTSLIDIDIQGIIAVFLVVEKSNWNLLHWSSKGTGVVTTLKWQLVDNRINFSKMLTAYFSKNACRIPAAIVTEIKSICDRLN